ncbi:hypothetical protein ACQKIY_26205 [Bacillus mycoides]|uniref:hypothetical protein n=1 Tax=Bacillus mycoides TaxID=1405 RepID=UPI003D058310
MKLGKLVLIGALTFSGFTAIEMIKPTSQVTAAYSDPFNDDWGLKPLWIWKVPWKVHINLIGKLGI